MKHEVAELKLKKGLIKSGKTFDKPSQNEEEYFRRLEEERKAKKNMR